MRSSVVSAGVLFLPPLTMLLVDAGVLVLLALTILLVLFVALLVWRHGYRRGWRSARQAPPTCLKCGYNLSGLTHCRCPECGTEHRLDELWLTPKLSTRSNVPPEARVVDPEPSTT